MTSINIMTWPINTQQIEKLQKDLERRRILDCLPVYGGGQRGFTIRQVADKSGMDVIAASRRLKSLQKQGNVTRKPAKGRYRYWKLVIREPGYPLNSIAPFLPWRLN